jgi:hypothetical protein
MVASEVARVVSLTATRLSHQASSARPHFYVFCPADVCSSASAATSCSSLGMHFQSRPMTSALSLSGRLALRPPPARIEGVCPEQAD